MPIATPEVYAEMLDRAKAGQFAYPAINVTSSQTLIAALRGFAEAESDGIIQFSWGAEFASGQLVKDMVTGAVVLAEFANVVAEKYPVNIALHTDHCPLQKLDGFMRPLVDISIERVKAGKLPLFQSHMWDGSAIPLDENLDIAEEMLDKCHQANIIMELEIGVVGVVRRTASRPSMTPSCSPLPRTAWPPRPSWAWVSAGGTCSRRHLRQCARGVQARKRGADP